MNRNKKRNEPEFNNSNEREDMQNESRKEENNIDATKRDDMSLGDSIRNYADVSGTTFGMDSNPAKFSNIENVNQTNNGGSGYSDYLNKADDEFISGTGRFSRTENSNDNKASDATQGKRDRNHDQNT